MYPEINLLGLHIQTYGVMVLIGFFAALFTVKIRTKNAGLKTDVFYLSVWALVGGFILAKVLYWITVAGRMITAIGNIGGTITFGEFFKDYILSGFVFYGGLIGGAIAVIWYLHDERQKVSDFVNIIMPAIPLAQGFGRIGCFFAGCCYGDVCITADMILPVQLVEAACNFAIFGILVLVLARRRIEWVEWDKELTSPTAFCPDCGKSLNGSSAFLNLSKKFWLTFIGAVPLVIMSMLNWATIPVSGYFTDRVVGFNLFNLRNILNDIGELLGIFDVQSQVFTVFKTIVIIMLVLLLLSFALLVISLIKNNSETRAKFAYWGFGLNAFVSAVFIVATWIINNQVGEASDGLILSVISLTFFPYFMFVIAVAAMIFFVKRPVLILNKKQKRPIGLALYLMMYSVVRFILEFFRQDTIRGNVGDLSTSQFIGIFLFVIGILLWIFEKPFYDFLDKLVLKPTRKMKKEATAAKTADASEKGEKAESETGETAGSDKPDKKEDR